LRTVNYCLLKTFVLICSLLFGETWLGVVESLWKITFFCTNRAITILAWLILVVHITHLIFVSNYIVYFKTLTIRNNLRHFLSKRISIMKLFFKAVNALILNNFCSYISALLFVTSSWLIISQYFLFLS